MSVPLRIPKRWRDKRTTYGGYARVYGVVCMYHTYVCGLIEVNVVRYLCMYMDGTYLINNYREPIGPLLVSAGTYPFPSLDFLHSKFHRG